MISDPYHISAVPRSGSPGINTDAGVFPFVGLDKDRGAATRRNLIQAAHDVRTKIGRNINRYPTAWMKLKETRLIGHSVGLMACCVTGMSTVPV